MEQSTNYLPYIITGLVMMLIGWAIGFFDSNLRTSKKIKQAEASAEVAVREAKNKIEAAEAKLASVAATPAVVDDPGIFRVKNDHGRLTLDLDGARVDTSSLTGDQRKRLVEMLTLMRPWLEGKPAAPPPPPPAQPKPAPVVSAPQAAPSVPVAPPSTATPNPSIIAKEDRPAAPAGSIVSQIDAILQAHLAASPLSNRGIFLAQSPEGGVIVYVGLSKYMGVDEVPDPEVKALIRGAIQEWERKYTPGL